MGDKEPTKDWKRRTVLKTVLAGSAIPLYSGVGAARGGPPGNECPECPSGTRLLAKYESVEDGFVFDEGACDDPLSNFDITNKEGESGEPIEVTFTSPILAHDIVVKRGRECEFASEADDITLTIDDEKDSDGFEHTISVPEDSKAISHFNVCAGICYQVDFVVGDVIENLGEDGRYKKRLISVRWDGTAEDGGEFVNNGASGFGTNDGDTITTVDGVTLNSDETKGSVSFDVELGSDDVKLTLASYAATCPPTFDNDTAHIQDLVDYQTVTYSADMTDQSLTVELPGLDWLEELCDI